MWVTIVAVSLAVGLYSMQKICGGQGIRQHLAVSGLTDKQDKISSR